MAHKLILSCLIEGWNEHFKVIISDGNLVNVEALRESIFEENCKTWNEDFRTLSLLKVNIPVVPSFDSDSDLSQINVDPNNPEHPLPLLRFNHGEMSLGQTLREVWPEPPPANRINFFVRFTDREFVLCIYKCPAFLL